MPVSPDHGARLTRGVVDQVVQAELVMLRRVRRALEAGIDAPEWVTVKLAELQTVRARLLRDLAGLDQQLAAGIESAVQQAYITGQALAVGDLDDARVRPALPAGQFAAVQTIAGDVIAAIDGVRPVALRAVTDAYQQAVAEASSTVLLGAQTRVEAAQQALDRLLGDGITGFRDSAGRNWTLESYVEMATRTGTGQAAIQGHTDTLAASGHDLVYVIPGPRPCTGPDGCDQWAGKVLSISGGTAEIVADGRRITVTPMAEARATGHLFGPNCRCSTGAYFPGVTTPNVERPDPAGYEAGQQQRYLERGVRRWKRRAELALTPEAKRAANAKVREWQARVREHVDTHDLKRLSRREQIGRAR